jgi:hypothetical protein
MGKYQSFRPEIKPPNKEIHPIWRGIGFVLIILIPILAYSATLVILQENSRKGWFPIPTDLIVNFSDPMILVKIFMTLIIALVLYVFMQLITNIINKMFGVGRYGPYDVPPESYRGPRYKR